MKAAVEFYREELNALVSLRETKFKTEQEIFEQAKEMRKEQNISLLEWIRNNAVEVQGGWKYDGWTHTDKEILEVYYKQCKQ
jgi:hypothetical protein